MSKSSPNHRRDTGKPRSKNRTSARRLRAEKRHWYNPLTWRRSVPPPPRQPISSAYSLMRQSIRLLAEQKIVFFTITMLFFLVSFALVQGFKIVTKDLEEFIPVGSGVFGAFQSSATRFGAIFKDLTTVDSPLAAFYQVVVTTIISLALLWALRKAIARKKVSVRDSFYKGMTPLIPYILILFILALMLIPFSVAGFIYSNVIVSGLLTHFTERMIVAGIFVLIGLISLYFIVPLPFALIGVTLPDIRPMHAYRSARAIVYKRRLLLLGKIFMGLVYLFVVLAIILLPFLMWLPYFAPWVLYMFMTIFVVVMQAFIFLLYREALYGKDS